MISASSATSLSQTTPFVWRRWMAFTALIVLIAVPIGLQIINHYWPFRYRNVEPLLQNVFASQIKMEHYHRIYFPYPGFVADGLTLRRNSAPDLPPVGSAEHLRVEGRWIDLLLLHKRVKLVYVEGLHVVIPPTGSRANKEDFPPGSSTDFAGPTTVVEELSIHNAELDLLRSEDGRYSFPIAHLVIRNLRRGEAISYDLDMQNAQPTGRIRAHGSFGPLTPNALGSTPVFGEFAFAPVNLADVHGISGTLSATGSFRGTLEDIETSAESTTPDFAVGSGRRTPVSTRVSVMVNGLNGDVLLRAVDVETGKTRIHAHGNIVGSPKVTRLELSVAEGRAEDLLRPFVHGKVPVTGAVRLHSHASIAAASGKRSFFERLRMDGGFDIPAELLTNRPTERKLTAFSLRAEKGSSPVDDPAGDYGVLSGLRGAVAVRNGIASTDRLTFLVPGAKINLRGSYDLRNQKAHLLGDLHMQTDVSHVTTGWKSLLLKPLAPLFKKDGAGAVVPIAITGSPGAYKVSQNILHDK